MHPKKPKVVTVDDYILQFPTVLKKRLQIVHQTIAQINPELKETISYGIAAFKYYEHSLIYFAGYKNHIGLYPIYENELTPELTKYRGKNTKGSIHFPHNTELPLELIIKVVSDKIKAKKSIL